jgi:PIN domain nuclease of toxin-antitoxin system
VLYLDTHVAVCLEAGSLGKLTSRGRDLIEVSPLLICPMVYLEFDYLYQRGRIRSSAATLYSNLNTHFGLSLCNHSFGAVAAMATEINWTSDPFDRLIVAQSKCNPKSKLLTADELILEKYERSVW